MKTLKNKFNYLFLFLPLIISLFFVSSNSFSDIETTGTIDIKVNCTPASNYTCYLYNCNGTSTGKQCGPTNSNGKCGVFDVV